MNQSNKALRDILGCTCSYTEQYNGKSYNLKTEEYEDCECVSKIPQIYALLTNHIKGKMPEKIDIEGMYELKDANSALKLPAKGKDAQEVVTKLAAHVGFNEAIDQVSQILKEMGE